MVRVKICGNTNLADALCAAEVGADLVGFILYPQSPRYVSVEDTSRIVHALRLHAAEAKWNMPLCVGVFANENATVIRSTVQQAGFDAVQLHGDETPGELSMVGTHAFKVIKLVDAQTQEFIAAANPNQGCPR